MQRRSFALPALCAVFAFSALTTVAGCSKTKAAAPTNQQSGAQDAPAWQLTLQSACGETPADNCLAGYGFTVDAKGHYKVGPSTGGQVATGSLSDDEFKTIDAALSKATGAGEVGVERVESCGVAEASESDDTITLKRLHGAESAILRSAGTNLCYRAAGAEEATALDEALRAIAGKYYTLPFPNNCTEAVTQLEALYPALQTCTKNEDCAYVDIDWQLAPKEAITYIPTENCLAAKPLIVANAVTVAGTLEKLSAAIQHTAESCGERFNRASCNLAGFQSTDAPAVCEQNVCKKNPSLQ